MRSGGPRLGVAVLLAFATATTACNGVDVVRLDCNVGRICRHVVGNLELTIPLEAITEDFHIIATRVQNPPDSLTIVPGSTWDIEVVPASADNFLPPAFVVIGIDSNALDSVPQVRASELGLYSMSVAGWQLLAQTTGDTIINAGVVHLSNRYTVMGAPAASITVTPPSFQLAGVPGVTLLLATVRSDSNTLLPDRVPVWTSSANNVATVSANGLVSAQAPGNAIITATIGTVSGSSSGVVAGAAGTGDPQPQTGDQILLDFRAGGNKDLQSCTDLTCARNRMGIHVGNIGFTTNFDGNNTRALVFQWLLNNGQATCTGNTGSQQDMFMETSTNVSGFADIYLQYKIWMGRTATGGGVGTVGSYSNVNLGGGTPGGHKWWVWFRTAAGNGDGRLTAEQSPTLWKMITTSYPGYTGPAPIADGAIGEVHYFGTDVTSGAWNPDANLNKVNTLTFRIRSETANNAQNGLMEVWANGALVQSKSNLYTSPLGFFGLQIGGPTWICPPADQTYYMWDIVVWKK